LPLRGVAHIRYEMLADVTAATTGVPTHDRIPTEQPATADVADMDCAAASVPYRTSVECGTATPVGYVWDSSANLENPLRLGNSSNGCRSIMGRIDAGGNPVRPSLLPLARTAPQPERPGARRSR